MREQQIILEKADGTRINMCVRNTPAKVPSLVKVVKSGPIVLGMSKLRTLYKLSGDIGSSVLGMHQSATMEYARCLTQLLPEVFSEEDLAHYHKKRVDFEVAASRRDAARSVRNSAERLGMALTMAQQKFLSEILP